MNRRSFFARLAGTLAALGGAKAGKPATFTAHPAVVYEGVGLCPVTLTAKKLTMSVPITPELLAAGSMTVNEMRAIFPTGTKRA